MKWRMILFTAFFSVAVWVASGQQTPAPAGSKAEAEVDWKKREEQFKEMMTGVVMEGRWCLVEDGELTEEKEESYRILDVLKAGGDTWIIRAQIKFGDREATVPVPVMVKWAGETPVITLDENTQIPQLGKYTARVVLHKGTYAGTWSGGEKKGLLHGIIKKR